MPRTRTYGLDIDTIRYAQRVKSGSGTTILPEPLKQINKFVIGVKKLGLWNSMVCWPMRSIHNAGTGSTVYSLGGLGVFNGIAQNSPVWGYQGLTTNRSLLSRVSLTLPTNVVDYPVTLISVFNATFTGGFQGAFSVRTLTGLQSPTLLLFPSNNLAASYIGGGADGTTNTLPIGTNFSFCVGRFTLGASRVTINKTQFPESILPANTGLSNTTQGWIGRHIQSAEGLQGTTAISMYIRTTSDTNFVYDLYRSTLGIGLNLP